MRHAINILLVLKLGLFFSIIILNGCQQNNSLKNNSLLLESKDSIALFDSSKYAIIQFDPNANYFLIQREIFPKTSKPSVLLKSEINELNTILQACVNEFNSGQVNGAYDAIDINKYRKQLIITTNVKGEKEVFINCFCDNDHPYWKTGIVDVFDGGECYFRVTINLTRKQYYDFNVGSLS